MIGSTSLGLQTILNTTGLANNTYIAAYYADAEHISLHIETVNVVPAGNAID
jgi:hypothetical protein